MIADLRLFWHVANLQSQIHILHSAIKRRMTNDFDRLKPALAGRYTITTTLDADLTTAL